jgi:hypothetical protein
MCLRSSGSPLAAPGHGRTKTEKENSDFTVAAGFAALQSARRDRWLGTLRSASRLGIPASIAQPGPSLAAIAPATRVVSLGYCAKLCRVARSTGNAVRR